MTYIDGYVIPVPDANRTAYRDFEARCGQPSATAAR